MEIFGKEHLISCYAAIFGLYPNTNILYQPAFLLSQQGMTISIVLYAILPSLRHFTAFFVSELKPAVVSPLVSGLSPSYYLHQNVVL